MGLANFWSFLSKNIFLPLLKKEEEEKEEDENEPKHCFCPFLKNTVLAKNLMI